MPAWSIHRRPRVAVTRLRNGEKHYQYAGQATLASAALISKEQVRSVVGRKEEWQRDAWELYDTVSELRFGVSWIANACSRARLYVGIIDGDGSSEPTPVSTDTTDGKPADPEALAAVAPLEELAGGQLGQSEMLRRLATHLNVPGQSYLVGYDDPDADDPEDARRWQVCSDDEIQSTGMGLRIASPSLPNEWIDVAMDQATVLRIWRPHPRYAYQADSPIVAMRQPLRELVDLSAHITASAESRLAGAGVLFVPDELTTPNPDQSEGANPLHADAFTAALIEAMAAPLKNRDSASAVVPLVVRGPADKGKELKHLSFSTKLDENVDKLRDSAIRRVATGMDMPPEVLTGMGESNHWSAWQIEESAIKLHIEPLLGLICDSLTANFLRPALKALGIGSWAKYAVWYDTTELVQRPDRSGDTVQAHGMGLISDAVGRRELGFSDEDAPTDAERLRNLVTQVLLAAPTLAPSLLPFLGIKIPETEAAAATADAVATNPTAVVPAGSPVKALPPVPGTRPPAPPAAPPAARPGTPPAGPGPGRPQTVPASRDDLARAMTASAARTTTTAATAAAPPWRTRCLDMAVRRALNRAGQYLLRSTPRADRARLQQLQPEAIHLTLHAQPDTLDQMLANAYTEFHEATPGETCLHTAVDNYVRALLLAREPHHAEYLDRAITQHGCDEVTYA